jgi:hypothetical protein
MPTNRPLDGDDREQIVRARQVAEALFASKREVSEHPVSESSQPATARKPRVLPIVSPGPIRREGVDAPARSEPPSAPEIPPKKLAHLRTLVNYGMTVSQAAQVYKVPVETIQRKFPKS